MIVRAPGKVLLSGAYAVLEGAPAIVAAVARYAVADSNSADPMPAREIAFAFGNTPAPRVVTKDLYDGGRKLGIGSSAAALVSALGAAAAAAGEDLASRAVRDSLFTKGREAHAAAQSGGSGVDVAASVYGGTLCYQLAPFRVQALTLPSALFVHVFSSKDAARTSDLRASVSRFGEREPSRYSGVMSKLQRAAHESVSAVDDNDAGAFIDASRVAFEGLCELGDGADMPIVPRAFAEFAAHVRPLGASFLPSGAGGGDVGVLFGTAPPSQTLLAQAEALGLTLLDIGWDTLGVHALPLGAPSAAVGPRQGIEVR